TVPTAATVNVWTNVMLSYAGPGADVQVYINGTLRATLANPNKAEVFSAQQLANMVLGSVPQTNPNAGLVPMDELRIYNKAFTPVQICSLLYGTVDANNTCHPVQPALDLNFELGELLNSGAWQDPITAAGKFTFQAAKVGNGLAIGNGDASIP